MKIKAIKTNDVTIEVTPRSEGNYGIFSISGQERSADAEYRLAEEIERNIKRHVDDVQYTYITQKIMYQDENQDNYDTLYELLDSNLNEELVGYRYRYERKSDNGVGTSGYINSFPELIETAWHNPNKFEVTGELTANQKKFLDAVLEKSLNREAI